MSSKVLQNFWTDCAQWGPIISNRKAKTSMKVIETRSAPMLCRHFCQQIRQAVLELFRFSQDHLRHVSRRALAREARRCG